MPKTRAALHRLRVNIRLALATWLVCKAIDLTPAEDIRTMVALGQLLKAMQSDEAVRRWPHGT